jgi:hypothetical protein
MNTGAWIMLFIGAGGLWGGLIFFVLYALRSSRNGADRRE